MRRLLYIMLLCLPMAARGQTLAVLDSLGLPHPTKAKALRYWFDDEDSAVQQSNQLNGQQTLDVSELINGVHTLHYQVIDEDDAVAYVSSGVFLKISQNQNAMALQSLRYWFDDNEANAQMLSQANGIHSIDAASLMEGLHTLHCQAIGTDATPYYTASAIFMKGGGSMDSGTLTAGKLQYWFDEEQAFQSVELSAGIQMLDASMLTEGLHTVHYQVQCTDGTITPPHSSIFLCMNVDTETAAAKNLRYWYDDETDVMETDVITGPQLLDATHLQEGLHTVHYQIADSKGRLGAPASAIFLKMDAQNATAATNIRYWFDDDTHVKMTTVAGGTQTLDVSDLLTGLHALHYQLVDSKGDVTAPVTALFMKNFDQVIEGDGHDHITMYEYWLNEDSKDRVKVTVNDTTDPYSLITLLPMPKSTIRSSLFHFEVTNGTPTIYAKNVFHVRFHDAQGYFTDEAKDYLDYGAKKVVESVGELQSKQTFAKVTENDIRWYTMQAAPGDTAAFRLSQPATVQVFAPSGKEVFTTSESASVKWGGLHTWEAGTYYVAVHDVTGSQNTMTLEYMHMDKYDVVDWDVHTVGNGGCSTITFKGNGFNDLYAVDLFDAAGKLIQALDITHDSDAETAVTFDFSGAALGACTMVFHFTEEDKRYTNILSVEEAIDIELATNVSFPSSFLRGTSTTYTIKITNKGNMTAYNVPVYVYLSSKNSADITNLSLKGLDLLPLYDFMNTDYWTEEERQEMKAYSDEVGDEHYFYKIRLYDIEMDDSVVVRKAFLFVNVSPNATKQFTLTLRSQQKVDAYFTIPTEWNSLTANENAEVKQNWKESISKGFCCYHDGFECALNSLAYTLSWVAIGGLAAGQGEVTLGAELVGCISSGISMLSNIGATFACERNRKLWGDKLRFGKLLSWAGTAGGCLTSALRAVEEVKHAISFGINQVQATFNLHDCAQSGKKPNCPPNPSGGGGSSTPYTPVDPNDIHGYLSETDTKFMADTLTKVNYTIEFENDTALADAAAHTIVIRDTLDSRYFDLKAFMPTSVKLGGKEEFLNEQDVIKASGEKSFVKTFDMRPEINAIAQVEGTFNEQTGIAEWRFSSLDPMTMEPTDDLMQGILPVNHDGTSGIGEVMFEIGMRQGKLDGSEVNNRASIIFDYEAPILTPTWTNIVDAVPPVSTITDVTMENDTIARLHIVGEDNRSGIWYYDIYAQMGAGTMWVKVGEHVTEPEFDYRVYEDIDYGYCVLAVDSAGNVEKKELRRDWPYDPNVPTPVLNMLGDGNDAPTYDLSGKQVPIRQKGVYVQKGRKRLLQK